MLLAKTTLKFTNEINEEVRRLQKILENPKAGVEILECVRRKDVMRRQLNGEMGTRLISSTVEDVRTLESVMHYLTLPRGSSSKAKAIDAKRALVRSLSMDLARLELITRWWITVIRMVISEASSAADAILSLVKLMIRLIFSDIWRFIWKVIRTGEI